MEIYKKEILERILAWEDRSIPFSVPFPGVLIIPPRIEETLNAHFRDHNVTIKVMLYDIKVEAKAKKKLRQFFEESNPDAVKQEKVLKEIADEINLKLDEANLKLPHSFMLKTPTLGSRLFRTARDFIVRSVIKGRESPGYQLNIAFTWKDEDEEPVWVDIYVKKE